jgi:hypothetical protein
LLGRLADGRANLRFRDARDFRNKALPQRFLLLRHDVDFCPRRALAMARLEAGAGYRATYFFLLTSEVYNLLTSEWLGALREIVALGHEVGLHYDAAALEAWSPGAPGEALEAQAGMLTALAGEPVVSVAMHNPSTGGADPFRGEGGKFINAYDDAFTREISYWSDSCGAWRNEAVRLLAGRDTPPRLQLLIHPLYWEETHGDRWSRLTAWEAERSRFLAAAAEAARDIWRRHPAVREHDQRLAAESQKDSHVAESG